MICPTEKASLGAPLPVDDSNRRLDVMLAQGPDFRHFAWIFAVSAQEELKS
jgi:hypothetical protein